MSVRVGVNGFGRIGRNFFRAVIASGADVDVVAVNDVTSPAVHAQLLRYDSTHGPLGVPVRVEGSVLVVGDRRITVLSERDPASLHWDDLGVQVVLEATGLFRSRSQAAGHLKGGAQRVIISAPSEDADLTVVMGVNDRAFDPALHHVVSNASCTTNCFVPMVKVIEDAFGIEGGLMTTVHAYTNDQNLLDLAHKDPRRARAAAMNIVPNVTGAARATHQVLPTMAGRLDGASFRVPVACGSITDFTVLVRGSVTVDQVNRAFEAAAREGPLSSVLEYTEDPIVSSDIVGNPASCIFDATLTLAQPMGERTLVKANGWYDNEWGYSNRLVDLVLLVGQPR
jgi:glyceraldehyde 3-phosphate dehydrogenase